MKVVNLKAAKAAIERKRYAQLVLGAFDQQARERAAPIREERAEVRRKAKDQL